MIRLSDCSGRHGECLGILTTCDRCGYLGEYQTTAHARHYGRIHVDEHVQDDELDRWVDRTLESIDWFEERAETVALEGIGA